MGLWAWRYSFKGSIAAAIFCWVYTHFAHCVLVKQVQAAAAIHKDSSEMVSINYWVEHQGNRSSVLDTGRMIPVIKSDRAGRPGIEFGGDGLHNVYVSECAFAPSLWNVSCVYHIHYFDC